MLKETPYAMGLRELGFVRVKDDVFFQYEVGGVLVAPVGRAYARISTPDHLTMVQDDNGYLYRINELVPTHYLMGKDVTKFLTVGTSHETRRLRGRAYVPQLKSPVRARAALCSRRIYARRITDKQRA